MKAIKAMGKIDDRGQLALDQPLVTNKNQQVEAIGLIPETSDSDRNHNQAKKRHFRSHVKISRTNFI